MTDPGSREPIHAYLFLDAGDRPQSPQAYFPGTDLNGRKEQELSRTFVLVGRHNPEPPAPQLLGHTPSFLLEAVQACAYPAEILPEPGEL